MSAPLDEAELDRNYFAGHREALRSREPFLCAFDGHAAVERKDRLIGHHVVAADRFQARGTELTQRSECPGDLLGIGELGEFDCAKTFQPAPLHPEIAAEPLAQGRLAPNLPIGSKLGRIG